MVSNARLDLPLPESPVMTVSRSRGIRTVTSLRLCSRAPRTTSSSCGTSPVYRSISTRTSVPFGYARAQGPGPLQEVAKRWSGSAPRRSRLDHSSQLVQWRPHRRQALQPPRDAGVSERTDLPGRDHVRAREERDVEGPIEAERLPLGSDPAHACRDILGSE